MRGGLAFGIASVAQACSGGVAKDPADHGPGGWHPVGTPIELPSQTAEVLVSNDSVESVWSIHPAARVVLKKSACSEVINQNCRVRACKAPSDPYSPSTELREVGSVSVFIGTQTEITIPETEPSALGSAPLWNGSTEIKVVAQGADVPAFQGEVIGPDRIETITPQFPAWGNVMEIAWDEPIQLTWKNGQSGQVVHAVVGWVGRPTPSENHQYSTDLDCEFDASVGSGEIPVEVLGEVPRPGGILDGWLGVYTRDSVTSQVDVYVVTISATNPGRSGDGNLAGAFLKAK